MKLNHFKLERYFAKYEFSTPFLLCCSDCEALSKSELLSLADQETLDLWNNLKFEYTESSGHPLLREEISYLYNTITPLDLITGIPQECIFLYMNSVLNANDHVIITYPGYQSLYEIAKSINCQVSTWQPRENENWEFDLNDLKKQITAETKLIVINFPHNPTGAILNESKINELIKIAEQKNILIFSDEMYRFLNFKPNSFNQSLSDLTPLATSLFGLSKTFSLPGLRLGWLSTKNKSIIKRVADFKDYTSICNNAAGEILGIIALRTKDKIIRTNLKIIKTNLSVLDAFFKKHSDIFQYNKPQAGPIAFLRLKTKISSTDLCHQLIKKGVLLLPSEVYDFGDRHFRIGFGRKNFKEALLKFEEFLKTCRLN